MSATSLRASAKFTSFSCSSPHRNPRMAHPDFGVRHWALSVRRLLHQIRRDRHHRVANPPTLRSRLILLIANLLHPVHRLAVQRFLNGDMRHRRPRGGAVPMFLTRGKPDHVAWPDFLDRAALALR